MSGRYVKSLENCASERGRRVRIYGVGNGLFRPEDPFSTQKLRKEDTREFMDGSTIGLLFLIVFASAYLYLNLSQEAGFRTGLYYELKYIEMGIFGFMSVLALVMTLFHHWIVVKTFENWFMRGVSALACASIYFIGFNLLFLLSGGTAHLQVNAVAHHCGAAYKEKECLQARSRLETIPAHHRQILVKTSSLYGKMKAVQASPADLALFQLIQHKTPKGKIIAQPLGR